MTYELRNIEEKLQQDRAGFIDACENGYHEKVHSAAKAVAENMKNSNVVLLAGPSGSGKTTTALKICDELKKIGIAARTISLDNYFRTIDETYPRQSNGEPDFESPDCVDMELLNEHCELIMARKPIRVPYYDFIEGRRSSDRYEDVIIGENEVVIFEGIHALNDRIAGVHPEAMSIFVGVTSDVSCGGEKYESSWVRLGRRAVRDRKFRGAEADYTLRLWKNVVFGEKKYIEPFSHHAHMNIDTFMPYEINVIKNELEDMFKNVPEGAENNDIRIKMLDLMGQFSAVSYGNVPADSLLREFIGGGIYSY